MNPTDIFLIAWACILFLAALVVAYFTLRKRSYSGKEVVFKDYRGWNIQIDSKEPVQLEGASSRYFRLTDGKTHLYGIPREPFPLRHSSADYFYLQPTEIRSGQWEVKDGSGVTFRLTCPQSFSIRISPTGETVVSHLFWSILMAAGVWALTTIIVVLVAIK